MGLEKAPGAKPAPPGQDRRRVGRPARISREMIAEAAHELGLENLTLKAVADHLGASIAALYHHVSSKDDLLRIGAEVGAGKVPQPTDTGQHWSVWLLEWALYNRDAFLRDPGLLTQFVCGGIRPEVMVDSLDRALGALVRQGFSVGQADHAYNLVSAIAIGSAVRGLRDRESQAEYGGEFAGYRRALDGAGAGTLPYLSELLEDPRPEDTSSFVERVKTAIVGVAATRGDDWRKVARKVDRARPVDAASQLS